MRKSVMLLTLALMGSVAMSAWLWHSREDEKQYAQELKTRVAALEHTVATENAGAVRAAQPTTPAAEPPATAIPTSPSGASPPRDTEVREHLRALAQQQREMLRDPTYRKSMIEAGRRQFARPRADAIRVVGMTPEQADRVIDLWVERNMRFNELGEGVPGERPSPEMQAELKRTGDAEQAELRALLGEDKYEKWGRYLASGEERAEVGQFREQLAGGADSLRDSQADALVEAIYSERQRRSREYEEYVRSMGITDRYAVSPQDRQHWLELEKEANQRIHSGIANVLSPKQLTSLDEMLAARLASVEATLRLQLQGDLAKSN